MLEDKWPFSCSTRCSTCTLPQSHHSFRALTARNLWQLWTVVILHNSTSHNDIPETTQPPASYSRNPICNFTDCRTGYAHVHVGLWWVKHHMMWVCNGCKESFQIFWSRLVLQRSEINDALTWWDYSLCCINATSLKLKNTLWFESYLDWIQLKPKGIWLVQFSATLPESVKCQKEPGRPEDAELQDTLQSSFHHSMIHYS